MSSENNQEQRAREPQEPPEWAFTLYSESRPEFYIHDNHYKNLAGCQQFAITVKRRSQCLGERDYVQLCLLEWSDDEGVSGRYTKTRQTKLYGTTKKRWDGQKSITFDDLEMVSAGIFRIHAEVYRYRGGEGHDALLQTLISNDIEFPEIEVEEESENVEI
ncbi:hypothetical protein ABKA04_007941 [Annulohypoxylon sp. FPYF3050]